MDTKYITPFIQATETVFKDFFKILPKLEKPFWMDDDEKTVWEISAIIGIAGEARGNVVLSFHENTAMILTGIVTGKSSGIVMDDVIDAIGEVVNIIAGNAKKGMEEFKLMISLPTVVRGQQHRVFGCGKNIPVIGIPFMTEHGPFLLSVCLENVIR
jgi:chemotaxis protein CheX